MQVLNSFTTTVEKALGEIDPKWRNYKGLVVCGSHLPYETEGIVDAIRDARESGTPFLGICAGHQLAWIEYCRNVLGIKDATSEEFSKTGTFVVKKRPELKVGLHDGETWWSDYDCDFSYKPFPKGTWEKADNFITVPYHPEYQSSKEKPHPILVNFLEACKSVL